jgi:outer membrane protein OmpA-like peptidoglycan-associated protein
MRKSVVLTALTCSLLAGAAFAQTNPSAQQIISALTPSGNMSGTTRGIKPLAPGSMGGAMAPMSGPMSGPMAMNAPKPALGTPIAQTNLNVNFQTGSAQLTPQAVSTLDQLGKALTSTTLSAYHFKIVGHTDTTGIEAANQSLSEERAAAVKSFLETNFKVSDARLQALGVGESDPMVPTPPNTPELRNRRVQIINIGQ